MIPMAFFLATAANDFFGGTVFDLGDTVSYALASSTTPFTGVRVSLSLAGPQVTLGSGSDTFVSIENLIGSNFGDVLSGNAGNNVLDGGAGQDKLTGGAGRDVFVFTAATDSPNSLPDVITDFNRLLGDRIDVSAIDANTSLAGNQAFTWVGLVSPFGLIAQGNLGYQVSGSDLILLGNTGTGPVAFSPDFRVLLQGSAPSGITALDVTL